MIELPDFTKAFDYENGFYLSCEATRLAKPLAHFELYRRVLDLPGALVECGVFKGVSLARFAMYRAMLGSEAARPIVGFDVFGRFPEITHAPDRALVDDFLRRAGSESISREQLLSVLRHKGLAAHVELIEGNILETVPRYAAEHPELRIALLNLDTDTYEPAQVILEHFWPRLVPGGVLVLDDYGVFPGETRAVDEYFADRNVELRRFPYAATPCYLVKP